MNQKGFSVGVEEEYQLVEPATGALRSLARDVLEADWAGEVQPEVQATQLEVRTRVCDSGDPLDAELRRLRFHVGSTAAASDLTFVAAGLHPFSRWQRHEHSRGERYLRLMERYGRVLRSEHVFGMHVHVAVPGHLDRVRLMRPLRRFLPHLLALSASSPFFEGEDTSYASYRAIIVRRLPFSGLPPRFTDTDDYRRNLELLLDAGLLEDEGAVYWSLRPHGCYPTLEFRAIDVCPRVEDAVAIAVLCRVLVAAAAGGRLDDSWPADAAGDALLAANEWQAARYGLAAVVVDPRRRAAAPIREEIETLLDRIEPTARDLGEADRLRDGIEAIVARGTAAERMRTVAARGDGLAAVVRWLAAESQLGTGLDRRRTQRANG